MRHLIYASIGLFLALASGPGLWSEENPPQPTGYTYAVPQGPAVRDRHTTFLASFDAPNRADADYCRHDPANGGMQYTPGVQGRFGTGLALIQEGSSAAFSGYDNYDPARGTASFWAQAAAGSNLWGDGQYHWLLILYPDSPLAYGERPAYTVFLYRDDHNVLHCNLYVGQPELYAFIQWYGPDPALHLELPTADLNPEAWHHFQVGWETQGELRLWLGIDGAGLTVHGGKGAEGRPVPGAQIFLGAIVFPTFTGHGPFQGAFDDLVIRNVSPAREALPVEGVDEADLLDLEDTVRGWLETCLELQEGGGWMAWYQVPSLRVTWGRHQVQDADDFSLEAVCTLLLRAYDLWGDERYLWACLEAGNFLVAAQTPAGCWAQYYALTPDGPHPDLPSGNLEEQTQSFPIRFLAHLYRVTGRPQYLEACRRGGEYVLARQGAEGWWPWGYNWKTKTIEGYGGPTLNDDAFGTSFEDMLVMYGVTGERKYLEAIQRAGEWLLNAQVKTGPARGWADQYDPPYTPRWGREMEPPSVAMSGTPSAMRDLLTLYDLTGDVRYLRSFELCLDWLESQREEVRGWLYYDLESGEPIMSYKGEVFSVFSDTFKKYYPQFSAHYSSGRTGYYAPTWARELERRRRGPQFPSWQGWRNRTEFGALTPTAATLLPKARAAVPEGPREALRQWNQSRSGPLVIDQGEYASRMLQFYAGNAHADTLMDAIEAKRVVLGDAPESLIPGYSRSAVGNWVYIHPEKDWYDTPLGPTEAVRDRVLKLRLHRKPHFLEMASNGEASFTLQATNWSSNRLAGTVRVGRAEGLKITPLERAFDLDPDASADLTFSVKAAGAPPGYVDIEFELTYGGMVERVPIRARLTP